MGCEQGTSSLPALLQESAVFCPVTVSTFLLKPEAMESGLLFPLYRSWQLFPEPFIHGL
jgi:hypothetical protein